ncbi:MAG: hypothetical protein IOC86_07430 [Aestuariivirga sp.]|nr:hypothetical protein [Aestuariivirga sp.]
MTYKRSQVEDSLWAHFRLGAAPERMPPAFRFRIKKLLDLDRQEASEREGVPLAFNDTRAAGQGLDVPFTSFHAFMLGLALEIWNAGLKQNDVVFFLRHCRTLLEGQHRRILAAGVSPFEDMMPLAGWPVRKINGIDTPDTAIYMVMDRIGLNELVSQPIASPEARQQPIFFEPRFCAGVSGLQAFFAEVSPSRRTHLVVELTELAVGIDKRLAATPARRRGRPS